MSAGGQDLNELVGVLNARLESRHIEATEQAGQIGDLKRELAELRTALNRLWDTDTDDSHAVHCEWYASSGTYCSCVGLTEITRLRSERDALQLAYNGANAMMGVHKRRADLLRDRLDHATAALAGDDEAIRLFMADHEQRVERLKEQARLAGVDAANSEAELNRILTEIEAERDKVRNAEGATARDESVITGIINGLGIALKIARGEA